MQLPIENAPSCASPSSVRESRASPAPGCSTSATASRCTRPRPGSAGTATPWRCRGAVGTIPVDTGFLVYNEPNYPQLTRLLAHLGVRSRPSDMSFGVSIDGGRFEYAGTSLSMFAQPSNSDAAALSRHAARHRPLPPRRAPLPGRRRSERADPGRFLADRGYGDWFRRRYLLPMGAAIWSASLDGMLDFPARTLLRFFDNHGLLSIDDRPQWRTDRGRLAGLRREACGAASRPRAAGDASRRGAPDPGRRRGRRRPRRPHASSTTSCSPVTPTRRWRLIERPDPTERALLGAFRYQPNRAVLHRDPSLMPRRRAVWSSWNYLASAGRESQGLGDLLAQPAAVHRSRMPGAGLAQPHARAARPTA